jgi:hypothetical protein
LGIGDWGLGIGQSPIPNPQSPFFKIKIENYYFKFKNKIKKYINYFCKFFFKLLIVCLLVVVPVFFDSTDPETILALDEILFLV